MSTKNDDVIMTASVTDCAVLSRSFSVCRSVCQDAENQTQGEYCIVSGKGQSSADSVCVALDGPAVSTSDWICVSGAFCMLYRIVVEKIAGFAAVVRWNRGFAKRRVRSHFKRCFERLVNRSSARSVVLSFAGGLRL